MNKLKGLRRAAKPFASTVPADETGDLISGFERVLESIGGKVYRVKNVIEIKEILRLEMPDLRRVISTIAELPGVGHPAGNPSSLADVDVFATRASLGVAENGAVWLGEDAMPHRVLPFICQHLVVVIEKRAIVASMHDAYQVIDDRDYGFALFIAGPSKTADIEQSLVLGAHGPVSMRVFITP